MSDFIKTSYVIDRGVRNHLDSKSEELLAEHTARSRDRHESSMSDYAIHGVNNTLTEGVLSMAQVISFLTAEKVEGYDTHDQLVNAILHTDIIEQFTRLVRPGYIGPATLSGLHMPQPIIVRDGRVVLNPEVVKILNSMRKEYRDSVMAKWALHEAGNSKAPQTLGLTCPAAAPKGAITAIKEGIFKAFYSTDI
jgi:hypothetical protein